MPTGYFQLRRRSCSWGACASKAGESGGAGDAVRELHHQPIGFRFLSHTTADVRQFQAGEVINAA